MKENLVIMDCYTNLLKEKYLQICDINLCLLYLITFLGYCDTTCFYSMHYNTQFLTLINVRKVINEHVREA